MTKQDFISRHKAWKQSTGKIGAIGVVCFFGILGVIAFVDSYLQHHGWSTRIDSILGLIAIVLLLGLLPLVFWFQKHQQKRFGVICPSCGKPLVGRNGNVVIATGNCGSCGEKVYDKSHAA
jgi:hypothetical protein